MLYYTPGVWFWCILLFSDLSWKAKLNQTTGFKKKNHCIDNTFALYINNQLCSWKMQMNLSYVSVTTNNNTHYQNAFVTAHIFKISSVHLDVGHPKGPNSTENKKRGHMASMSPAPCDPPRLNSHPVEEKGFQGAKQCWSPVDISGPWKIRN